MKILIGVILVCAIVFSIVVESSQKDEAKKAKKKKDLVDYSEAEIERLFEEWEVNKNYLNRIELKKISLICGLMFEGK